MARRRNKEAAETLERELAALRAGTAGAGEPALLLTDAANPPAHRSEAPSPPPPQPLRNKRLTTIVNYPWIN